MAITKQPTGKGKKAIAEEEQHPKKKQKVPTAIAEEEQHSKKQQKVPIKYPDKIVTEGELQKTRLAILKKKRVVPSRYVYDNALDRLVIRSKFVSLLGSIGWYQLLSMACPTYEKLVLEFLSSFVKIDEEEGGGCRFRIANVTYEMNRDEIGEVFGWETNVVEVPPANFETRTLQELSGNNELIYKAVNCKASNLSTYEYRYLHRVLGFTLFGRGESNGNITKGEIEVLYYAHHGLKPDFVALHINHFERVAGNSKGEIAYGGMITAIAEKLGVFSSKRTNLRKLDPEPLRIDEKMLLAMKWLRHDRVLGLAREPIRIEGVNEHMAMETERDQEDVTDDTYSDARAWFRRYATYSNSRFEAMQKRKAANSTPTSGDDC